ncbi:hypothetical protein GH733_013946 [Mirounga leonina]|nr:hypothetical protein GH733_013946 [Mirounga leonina]
MPVKSCWVLVQSDSTGLLLGFLHAGGLPSLKVRSEDTRTICSRKLSQVERRRQCLKYWLRSLTQDSGCHSERGCHHAHPPAMNVLAQLLQLPDQRNKQTYSTKPNNLKAHSFFHYHFHPIHCKAVGVELVANGKGTTTNTNATLGSIRHMICKNKYCPDLRMAAIHRASAILCSQKQQPAPTKSS